MGGGVSANFKNIKTHKYFFTYLNMVYFLWDCSVSDRTIGPIFSIIGGRCSVNRRGLLGGRGLFC